MTQQYKREWAADSLRILLNYLINQLSECIFHQQRILIDHKLYSCSKVEQYLLDCRIFWQNSRMCFLVFDQFFFLCTIWSLTFKCHFPFIHITHPSETLCPAHLCLIINSKPRLLSWCYDNAWHPSVMYQIASDNRLAFLDSHCP